MSSNLEIRLYQVDPDSGLEVVGYGDGGRLKLAPPGADASWEDPPTESSSSNSNSSENGK